MPATGGDASGGPPPGSGRISVVVPTRNRPDHVAACVVSILECLDDEFTVTVVDQSDDGATFTALAEVDDPRVRHVFTATRGAAAARNVGISETEGEIVAFTDDDCRVDVEWLTSFRTVLEDPSVALVFGGVRMGESGDPDASAAEFMPPGTVVYADLPPVREPWGISASLAARRSVLQAVHGFDELLGPGAPIDTGGEDSDLFIRVLAAGWRVAATDRTVVTHLGFRSGAEASELYRGYAYALGAVFMKHARLGSRPGRGQLPRWIVHFSWMAMRNVVRRRRPTGAGFALSLVRGAAIATTIPVDRATGRFARPQPVGRR